ncbi:MAG: SPOR domain-containing protein [Alphaproteobacteria bacterium]|nr:SPOR domain-containing protein [Alphaproteobacteria bacterium]
MRIRSLLLVSLLFAAWSFCASAAQSTFFIQLGSASSAEEAQTSWDKLRGEYPALLSNLTFTPRTLKTMDGSGSTVRLQAGPLRSRMQAQHLCGRLSARGVDCFIVETAVTGGEPSFAPAPVASSQVASASGEPVKGILPPDAPSVALYTPGAYTTAQNNSSNNPYIAEASPAAGQAAAATPAPSRAPVEAKLLPWQHEAPSSAAAEPVQPAAPIQPVQPAAPAQIPAPEPSPAERAAGRSRVEVAEAVRVPTGSDASYSTYPTYDKPAAPMVSVTASQKSLTTAMQERNQSVRITGFANEQDAYNFSQALHGEIPETNGLRMRISRPFLAMHAGEKPISLVLGPVPDRDMISRICAIAEQRGQQCGVTFIKGDSAVSFTPRTRHSFAGNPSPIGAGHFWAQLGSSRTADEARQKFKELQKTYPPLRGYAPTISTPAHLSLYAQANARLRVGPFNQRAAADALCDRLNSQGASCIVLSE